MVNTKYVLIIAIPCVVCDFDTQGTLFPRGVIRLGQRRGSGNRNIILDDKRERYCENKEAKCVTRSLFLQGFFGG